MPFLPPATSGGPTPSITLTRQSGSMRTFSPTSDLACHLLLMAARSGSYPSLLSPKHHLSRMLRGTRGTRCQRSQPQPVSQSTKSQSLLQSCFHLVRRRLNSELLRTTLSSDPLKTPLTVVARTHALSRRTQCSRPDTEKHILQCKKKNKRKH